MPQDPMAYLSAELQRLDLLLHREILRLRASYQLSLDEFRGLYISDQQVDRLVDQATGETAESTVAELTRQAEDLRARNAGQFGFDLPWHRLVETFALSPVEQELLLIAAAPEIALKYESLYAYLNNDVTRKWPTCDLASHLLADDARQRLAVRRALLPEAKLFREGLLHPIQPASDRPVWLGSGFSLAPAVGHYLLGLQTLPASLAGFATLHTPQAEWERLPLNAELRSTLRRVPALISTVAPGRPLPLLFLIGRRGTGRRQAAEAICADLNLPLLRIDLEAARAAEALHKIAPAIALAQRLQQAGLLLENADALYDKEGRPLPESHGFISTLASGRAPVFVACEPSAPWRDLRGGRAALHFQFETPDYAARLDLWEHCLAQVETTIAGEDARALADRFALTPGQIRAAVNAALDLQRLQAVPELSAQSLFEAARDQSDQSLGQLAVKVPTLHDWDDLILPRATMRQVREVAGAVRHRHVVYGEWGFEKRIAYGRGLKVLFSGSSGTGKTMTAGVIARDLGLDLYKIDLSAIVSKYIGETEKNLDRIFRAAQASNAILFFDEADALFGKRSEVKDAHDRYANIEVAYLLQKLEEHDGAVILASNLSQNIDNAFSRRMHYVVEFPLPDEKQREQLWRGMFPPQTPLGADVDFPFLAKQFPLAGGDIRNVALDAAFLAAQDGRVVTMRQMIQATARQLTKQGRITSATDFKQYHTLIMQDE